MANGMLTAQIAHLLQQEPNLQEFDVLHDHRHIEDSADKLGKLRSWFGSTLKSETVLGDLDIAIVSRHDKKVYTLIEIEETTDKPKVILGDILSILLGNGVAFKGKRDLLQVGKWTTLVVMVHDPHQLHLARCSFIAEQTNSLKENLTTPNKTIGRIIVESFTDEIQLGKKLREYIYEAVNQHRTP
jgi:hypothetical protein